MADSIRYLAGKIPVRQKTGGVFHNWLMLFPVLAGW